MSHQIKWIDNCGDIQAIRTFESEEDAAIAFNNLSSAAASLRAETGITSSAAHAEANAPGWSDHALGLLGRFACTPRYVCSDTGKYGGYRAPFTMEQFRLWAYEHGLPTPAEERCWGAVTQKALRLSLIVKVGYAAAASSNNSPKATYRGVV